MVYRVGNLTRIFLQSIQSFGFDEVRMYQGLWLLFDKFDCGRECEVSRGRRVVLVVWDYEEFAGMDPGTVVVDFRAQPFRQNVGSLDQEKLPVTVVNPDPDIGVGCRDLPQDVDNEPLVFYGITIVRSSMEVDQLFGAPLVS